MAVRQLCWAQAIIKRCCDLFLCFFISFFLFSAPNLRVALSIVIKFRHMLEITQSYTRYTLDWNQSNYSSRIVFSHIPIAFVQTGISAIRFDDPENPILEPKTA